MLHSKTHTIPFTLIRISTHAPSFYIHFCNLEYTGSTFFLTESKGTAAYVSRIWCSDSSSVLGLSVNFPFYNPTKRNCVEVDLRLSRSQWPQDIRRGSRSVRLLGFRVRILLWAGMSVSCECCVLSGRDL